MHSALIIQSGCLQFPPIQGCWVLLLLQRELFLRAAFSHQVVASNEDFYRRRPPAVADPRPEEALGPTGDPPRPTYRALPPHGSLPIAPPTYLVSLLREAVRVLVVPHLYTTGRRRA